MSASRFTSVGSQFGGTSLSLVFGTLEPRRVGLLVEGEALPIVYGSAGKVGAKPTRLKSGMRKNYGNK